MVSELRYGNTNTYLIRGRDGFLLFDTDWAGTFPALCRTLGEKKLRLQDIRALMISHFHPDHMGIAQELGNQGIELLIFDVQRDFVHASDRILAGEPRKGFIPIDDRRAKWLALSDSRDYLRQMGIDGEVLYTPGHSDDSISLWLDEGTLLVGDLNPLYELEMHRGTLIEKTWNRLLERKPGRIYYGHARPFFREDIGEEIISPGGMAASGRETGYDMDAPGRMAVSTRVEQGKDKEELYSLVRSIMKYIDKGIPMHKIQKKTGADPVFIEDVTRMYLTHRDVSVQGILDRIEIKGR